MDGCEVQRLRSECIGEMHAQRRSANGQVKNLPHGCVAQIVSRQSRCAAPASAAMLPNSPPKSALSPSASALVCARMQVANTTAQSISPIFSRLFHTIGLP